MTSKFTREQLIKKAQEQIAFCRHTKITGEGLAHVNQCAALFEIALAAMGGEPRLHIKDQQAQVTEREPIAWLNDAYLARGVVDGEAGSEDAGPGYIPVYREAGPQPAPVVSGEVLYRLENEANHITAWHHMDEHSCKVSRRDLLTLVSACRAAMLNGGKS